MPYRSRLAAVLFQRRSIEEASYGAFATARNLLEKEQQQLFLLDKKLQETLDDFSERQGTKLTLEEMTLYFRFLERQQERIADQKKNVLHHEAVCEQKRVVLEAAVRERKAVENIEEKREKAYRKTLLKKEQTVLDEVAGQMKQRHHE